MFVLPDRQIRQRACALKDTVHAIIRDELDEDFEKICEDIKESRSTRGECASWSPSGKTLNTLSQLWSKGSLDHFNKTVIKCLVNAPLRSLCQKRP